MMEPVVRPSFKASLFERLLVNIFHFVNNFIAWHKLPSFLGAVNLEALRVELRQYNLHDVYASGTAQGNQTTDPMTDKRFEHARNSDGKFNSTEMPRMGCAGMRFGRNFPRQLTPKPTEEELWNPNPVLGGFTSFDPCNSCCRDCDWTESFPRTLKSTC